MSSSTYIKYYNDHLEKDMTTDTTFPILIRHLDFRYKFLFYMMLLIALRLKKNLSPSTCDITMFCIYIHI